MLSIGKLVAGAEDYYMGMVAHGREEYYTGSGEAPGSWIGSGIDALSLNGEVDPEALRQLLAGISPLDGSVLGARRNGPRGRVAGFDLTFSAPKSVSLLYGLGDPETSAAARATHDQAVADGLAYLERHAVVARRGHDGLTRIQTGGLVGAAFVHRTSRAGDPQLHTHVLAANVVLGEDGRWSAPEARLMYFHARTAGFVYQASLRAGLVASLGVRFGPISKGVGEVAGMDATLLRRFSTRRAQIEEYLFVHGESSRRSAELAALATRESKAALATITGTSLELRQRWRAQALDFGADLGRPLFERVRPREATRRRLDVRAIVGELLGADGLTAHESVFERRDVVRAVAERLPEGATLAELEGLTDGVLDGVDVVPLVGSGAGGESLATTTELLAIECELLEMAQSRRPGPRLDGEQVELVLAHHPQLSAEQRAMVETLATSGAGIDVVVGKAGAGKTTALAVTRSAFEQAGYAVTGTALSARAAEELSISAGIDSLTLARLMAEIDTGERILSTRDVVVVDEAGMVGTRTLARLVALSAESGSKVILVGDPRQLPEIEAGGAFGALAARLGAIELTENRRQHALWERVALDHLRRGDASGAIEAYVEHDRVQVSSSAAEARTAMVGSWLGARRDGAHALMLAVSRSDVDALNGVARAELRAGGVLGHDVLTVGERNFALGDEVLCLRNNAVCCLIPPPC